MKDSLFLSAVGMVTDTGRSSKPEQQPMVLNSPVVERVQKDVVLNDERAEKRGVCVWYYYIYFFLTVKRVTVKLLRSREVETLIFLRWEGDQ